MLDFNLKEELLMNVSNNGNANGGGPYSSWGYKENTETEMDFDEQEMFETAVISLSHLQRLKIDHSKCVIKLSEFGNIKLDPTRKRPRSFFDKKIVFKKSRLENTTEVLFDKYFNFKVIECLRPRIFVTSYIQVKLPTTLKEVKRVAFNCYVSKLSENRSIDNIAVREGNTIIENDEELSKRIEAAAALTICYKKA